MDALDAQGRLARFTEFATDVRHTILLSQVRVIAQRLAEWSHATWPDATTVVITVSGWRDPADLTADQPTAHTVRLVGGCYGSETGAGLDLVLPGPIDDAVWDLIYMFDSFPAGTLDELLAGELSWVHSFGRSGATGSHVGWRISDLLNMDVQPDIALISRVADALSPPKD